MPEGRRSCAVACASRGCERGEIVPEGVVVRRFLLSKPRAVAVLAAVLAGVVTVGGAIVLALLAYAPRSFEEPVFHIVVWGAFGTVIGLVHGVGIARSDAAQRRVLAAIAAVEGGPVPADPQVRRAAARLAEHRLEKLVNGAASWKAAWWPPLFFSLVMADKAFNGSGWYWLAAALCVGGACVTGSVPRRGRRRVEHLRARLDHLREGAAAV
jgi:hypothetical protein